MILEPYELARSLGQDEATAADIRAIINNDRSGWKKIWLERLNDPRFRELHSWRTSDYLTPSELRLVIASRERCQDPFEVAVRLGCDDATATELRQILDKDWTLWREMWLERLNDDTYVAKYPAVVAHYLDPTHLRRIIAGRERGFDPFDPDTIRVREWIAAGRAGAETVVVEIATGQEVDRYVTPGSREGAAPRN